MIGPRIGTRFHGWSRRHLTPEFVETVVTPLVADMQFEELQSRGRRRWIRRLICIRGYFAAVNSLGLGIVTMMPVMRTGSGATLLRVMVTPVAALAGAAAAQLILHSAMWHAVGPSGANITNHLSFFLKSAMLVGIPASIVPLRYANWIAGVACCTTLALNGQFILIEMLRSPSDARGLSSPAFSEVVGGGLALYWTCARATRRTGWSEARGLQRPLARGPQLTEFCPCCMPRPGAPSRRANCAEESAAPSPALLPRILGRQSEAPTA